MTNNKDGQTRALFKSRIQQSDERSYSAYVGTIWLNKKATGFNLVPNYKLPERVDKQGNVTTNNMEIYFDELLDDQLQALVNYAKTRDIVADEGGKS